MRINDRLVIQRPGDEVIVLLDESSGQEVLVPIRDLPRVVRAFVYLGTGDAEGAQFIENLFQPVADEVPE